ARTPRRRCSAATSSACRRDPRSAGCSPSSRRSAPSARSARERRHSSLHDAVHARFARTAERVAARQDAHAAALAERLRALLVTPGAERALDVGTGAGALALALAPLVREVVGVDLVPELLELARDRAAGYPNVTFVEGD